MKGAVNFLEVPRVFDGLLVEVGLGAFGDPANIRSDATSDVFVLRRVDEFAAGEFEIGLLIQGNRRTPFVPSFFVETGIQVAADDADEDFLLGHFISLQNQPAGVWVLLPWYAGQN